MESKKRSGRSIFLRSLVSAAAAAVIIWALVSRTFSGGSHETDSEPLVFDEMKAFLKDRGLMNQKIPEQLEIVAELPKNPTGKVLKRQLKQQFEACL